MIINFKNKGLDFPLLTALAILTIFPLTILSVIDVNDFFDSFLNTVLNIVGFLYKKS